MTTPTLETFYYQYQNFKTLLREKGFKTAVSEAVYFNREIVMVERDLNKPLPKLKGDFDLRLITVNEDENNMGVTRKLKFSNKVRELKFNAYSRRGYKAFLGIHNEKVVAEQWWMSALDVQHNIIHPDLRWLKLDLKDGEIYAFDLLIVPEYRGAPLTNKFIFSYINELKKLGHSKIYGTFFLDNIPSLWIHRMLSYNETQKMKRHRFFFLEIKNGKICFA